MITLQEQTNRLWKLKNECNLDVYYQVGDIYGLPALINRVNKHSDYTGKNHWTKFTTVVLVNSENPDLYDIHLIFKNIPSQGLFCKKRVPMEECHFWMKQFYSSVQIMLRSPLFVASTYDRIMESGEYEEQYARLKKLSDMKAASKQR